VTTSVLTRLPPLPPAPARPAPPRRSARARLRSWLARHRLGVIGYLLPALTAAVVVLGWFRPGHFIASGDVPPFVRDNLAREWWSLWSHQSSGTGSTSHEAGRAADILLLALFRAAHLSEVAAQATLFALCCGLAAFGSAFFTATWIRRPWVVSAVGAAGAFNVFLLVNLPNLLPAVTVGVAGLIGGLLLRAAQRRAAGSLRLVAASVPLGYLSLNPPLLVAVLGWGLAVICAARLLTGRGGCVRAGRLALRALPAAMVVGAWWLVPFVMANLAPAGLVFAAETDVQAWAWSQSRNSIANVLTLNAHWGWSHPEYFPYAPAMDAAPWAWARWLLPALALLGIVLPSPRRRRAALTLGAALVLLVVVAKGLHPPGRAVNAWLYEHVPGMWLFREPMSKAGPFLVLLEGTLAGLAVVRLLDDPRLRGRWRAAVAGALALGAVGALAHPWPLWTGAVVAEDRPPMPGGHVAVPEDWRTTAEEINHSGGSGSVLVLPLNPYYQVTTSWGYHGVDEVPKQLLDRPVLQAMPGGYFSPPPVVQALTSDVAEALLEGDAERARHRLEALGVSTVVVRRDLVLGTTDLAFADPDALARGMAAMTDVHVISDTAVATAWRLGGSVQPVRAYSDLVVALPGTPEQVSAAVAGLPGHVVATRERVTADGVAWQPAGGGDHATFSLARPGTFELRTASATDGYFRAAVQTLPGPRYQVVLTPTAALTLDGRAVAGQQPVHLTPVPERLTALVVDGAVHDLTPEPVVRLADRSQLMLLAAGPAVPAGPPVGSGDCNNDPDVPARGLSVTVEADTGVRLTSETHAACAWWRVGDLPGTGPLLVEVTARSERGAPPRSCLWRPGERRCLSPTVTAGQRSDRHLTFLDVSADTAGDELYVYADGVPGGTSTVYEAPVVRRVRIMAETEIGLRPGAPVRVDLAAGEHEIGYGEEIPETPLMPLSAVEDCNTAAGGDDKELVVREIPRGAQLRAVAGVACAWTRPGGSLPSGRHRLSLSYRTVSGQPARVCVWQSGPDRCADIPALPRRGRGWQTYTTEVSPVAGTRDLRLYVYADGQGTLPTVTEYRDLELRPAASLAATVTPVAAGRTPEVSSDCRPSRCEIDVRGAQGRFVLELAESWAAGWELSGLPAGWTAERLETSGYANGWRISGDGDASLVVAYGPQRIVSAAQAASAVCALVIAGLWPTRTLLRRRRRAGAPIPPSWRGSRGTTTAQRPSAGTPRPRAG
jgi:arabinofuranan 3-O-arabinosyltransferase